MNAHPRRTLILQILKLIVWAVIATALVKFAFFPAQDKLETLNPQGNFDLPTTTVTTGNIDNVTKLDATVIRDESKTLKATANGTIVWFYVDDGASVNTDTAILQILETTTVESDDPEEGPTTIEHYHDVYAPAAGTLKLDALKGQEVTIGTALGTIVPASFHVQVSVTPDQLYSLQGLPSEATVAITDGPAPFTCTNLTVFSGGPVNATPSSDAGGGTGDTSPNSAPQLRCSIPADQTVFDGVKATLEITGQSAENVLLLPVTAVEGRFREGFVYRPADDPKQKAEKISVTLGPNDGQFIAITKGLAEGDEVLEFVPHYEEDNDDNSSPSHGFGG